MGRSPGARRRRIDSEIHRNYHLWPSNYIAHDELSGQQNNADRYSAEELKNFMYRFRRENADVKSLALQIYATAVSNKLDSSLA